MVEIIDAVVERFERIGLGVKRDFARGSERHELDQIGIRSHQIPDEVDLRRDDIDQRDTQRAAVTDDVVAPGSAQKRDTVRDCAALPNEVEYDFGAEAVGDLLHRVDLLSVREHGVIGTELLCQRERAFGTVDDDDRRGRQGPQHLYPDVAEPAGADHDGGGSGIQ